MSDDTKKAADRMHKLAQKSGKVNDYELAADLYEKAGYYNLARQCREAAQRLQQAVVNA